MFAMLRSIDLARVPALADRGVLGRQPERVEALRMQDAHSVATAEVRDDVADRVDEHVAHVQLARRVREHLQHVALREPLAVRGRRVRDLEGMRLGPDGLPALLDRLRVVCVHRQSHSCRGTKKPLAREAGWDRRGGAALGPWAIARSCCTSRKRYQAESGDARALPRFGTHRAGSALARWRRGRRAGGTVRHAARRVLRGDDPCAGPKPARQPCPTHSSSTVRRRSRTWPCFGSSPRTASEPTPPRSASSRSHERPGSAASSSSCTETRSRTRSCARRPMQARPSSSTGKERPGEPSRRASGASSSA